MCGGDAQFYTGAADERYRVGVRHKGCYREIFNSDSHFYGGSNMGNGLGMDTSDISWNGEPQSLTLTLPPLAGSCCSECFDGIRGRVCLH